MVKKSKGRSSRRKVLATIRELRRTMEFMDCACSPLNVISDQGDKNKLFWWKQGYIYALSRLREIA